MKLKLIVFLALILTVHLNLKGQGFKPVEPDTVKISSVSKLGDARSWMEIYLTQNYISQARRDSVRYFSGNDHYGVCGYVQNYLHQIKHSVDGCDVEKGFNQRIYFPKMELKEAQNLIQKLFYNPENRWETEKRYAPDGVGCYYEIIQTPRQTIIYNYCGC